MKSLFPISAGLAALAVCAVAQEHIPTPAPVDDGPLVANPEQDSLDMADMLYKQSQEPQTKAATRRNMRACLMPEPAQVTLNCPSGSPVPPRLLWQNTARPCA